MITLQLEQLEKSFGPKKVFEGLNLTHSQHTLGIAGSNGSGKSTLLKCLASLLPPTKGHVSWQDESNPIPLEEVRLRLGYAAPYVNLYDELSCHENLTFLSQVRSQDYNNSIDQWLQKVGLAKVADQPFGTISTGQRQRLRLAAALFHQPDILLLDEPGSNLDAEGDALIKEIAHQFDIPEKLLIIASNNEQELNLCQKIYSVEQENILKNNAPKSIE